MGCKCTWHIDSWDQNMGGSKGYYFPDDVAQCMSRFWFHLYRIYRFVDAIDGMHVLVRKCTPSGSKYNHLFPYFKRLRLGCCWCKICHLHTKAWKICFSAMQVLKSRFKACQLIWPCTQQDKTIEKIKWQ